MKPTVMILGVFHMDDQVLEPQRQAEMEETAERLCRFRPTKIAVEIPVKSGDLVNRDYRAYLDGRLSIKTPGVAPSGYRTSNEVFQLAFRLAERCGHSQIHATDWMENVGQRSCGDVMEWAEKHQPDLYRDMMEHAKKLERHDHAYRPIFRILKDLNDPAFNLADHQLYIRYFARIAEGTDYVGIDWMRWWYQRNLIIFSNIAAIATQPEDRILAMYGCSHNHLLLQFLRESELFELESPLDYLD
jgi:hypothetical protein